MTFWAVSPCQAQTVICVERKKDFVEGTVYWAITVQFLLFTLHRTLYNPAVLHRNRQIGPDTWHLFWVRQIWSARMGRPLSKWNEVFEQLPRSIRRCLWIKHMQKTRMPASPSWSLRLIYVLCSYYHQFWDDLWWFGSPPWNSASWQRDLLFQGCGEAFGTIRGQC
jgi:hypothetical protein